MEIKFKVKEVPAKKGGELCEGCTLEVTQGICLADEITLTITCGDNNTIYVIDDE